MKMYGILIGRVGIRGNLFWEHSVLPPSGSMAWNFYWEGAGWEVRQLLCLRKITLLGAEDAKSHAQEHC